MNAVHTLGFGTVVESCSSPIRLHAFFPPLVFVVASVVVMATLFGTGEDANGERVNCGLRWQSIAK